MAQNRSKKRSSAREDIVAIDDTSDRLSSINKDFGAYGRGNGFLVKTALMPAYPGAPKPRIILRRTRDVFEACKGLTKFDREHLVVLCLDFDCRLLAICEVAIGVADSVEQDWPEILRPVVASGAKAVIMVHNHPSGATGREGGSRPSADDKRFAKASETIFRAINVFLLDWVVVSENSYSTALAPLKKR